MIKTGVIENAVFISAKIVLSVNTWLAKRQIVFV
jgi:hypothetical protein